MSYVGPIFRHDLFISYAWVNNQKAAGETLGWVEQFRQELERELAGLIGRTTLEVWRDTRDLDSNHNFDDEIKSAINETAFFVALTSNGYIDPDSYCRKELSWFHKKASDERYGLTIGNRSRIFNVLLNNIPHEKWATEFSGTAGRKFHDAADATEFGRPLDTKHPEYRLAMRKLADEIYRSLMEFREVLENTTAEPPAVAGKYKEVTVFLAHTADTLTFDVKERLLTDLQASGVRVVTDVPPPHDLKGHDEAVLTAAEKASLSIHLLDGNPGAKVAGTAGEFYPRRQAELLLEKPTPQLIWVPKKLNLKTVPHEEHRQFLDQLANSPRAKLSYSLVRSPATSLAREVFSVLDEVTKPSPSATGTTALIDSHQKDQPYAFKLTDVLVKNRVLPLITAGEDDPKKNVEGFEDMLRQAALFIVIFGYVADEWVVARIKEAVKISSGTGKHSLKACGVYLAPRNDGVQNRQLNLGALPVSIPIFWFKDPVALGAVASNLG
jgi:hypothetical protein